MSIPAQRGSHPHQPCPKIVPSIILRSDDCSLFKVCSTPFPNPDPISILATLSHYEAARGITKREKERERYRRRPLYVQIPEEVEPIPFRHQPPSRWKKNPSVSGQFRVPQRAMISTRMGSRCNCSKAWLLSPPRRRGATIARRRDYPSFAGQRIFSSWAPPLHGGWRGGGIYKAEASHGSFAFVHTWQT